VYTWEEIRKHRSATSAWIVVRNSVYDVTEYLPKHPGGPHTLLLASGQDVTYLFETSHPFTDIPHKLLNTFRIGKTDSFVEYSTDSPFYDELRAKVKDYFRKNGKDLKDPMPTIKTALFLLFLWIVGYFYGFVYGSLWAAALLGVARALFGINTMHASSHFAVSHQPWVWRWLDWFCFDILMGGSNIAWNYQHIVGHHQHTNVFQADPDFPVIVEGDIRRVVKEQKPQVWYRTQAIHLPILYTLLALKTRVTDAVLMSGNYMCGTIHMNITRSDLIWLYITKLWFVIYQFLIPLYVFGLPAKQFCYSFLIAELAAGAWLAYFFQVNHVSDGALYTNTKDAKKIQEWAILQVESTVEYSHGDPLFTFLSGTLNYQAIHHLFPSLAPHYYAELVPIVKETCKKYKVKYQVLPNFWVAAWHHIKELHRMGQMGIAGEISP